MGTGGRDLFKYVGSLFFQKADQMSRGKFDPKPIKMKQSKWVVRRVDGRTKLGKELEKRVKELKKERGGE